MLDARAGSEALGLNVAVVTDDRESALLAPLFAEPSIVIVAELPIVGVEVSDVLSARPDVVVIVAGGDGGDATELIRLIAGDSHSSQLAVVLAFSSENSECDLAKACRRGARGIVTDEGMLLHAVRLVARGYLVIPRLIGSDFLRGYDPRGAADQGQSSLTTREHDIVRLLATGHSNAEISRFLQLSENTVKVYVQRIMDKLELRNRASVVRFAYDNGILEV
jgi:DNA-binding NarL/FixJ family response regulator